MCVNIIIYKYTLFITSSFTIKQYPNWEYTLYVNIHYLKKWFTANFIYIHKKTNNHSKYFAAYNYVHSDQQKTVHMFCLDGDLTQDLSLLKSHVLFRLSS